MLAAIVYGLTPDERWNARFNPGVAAAATPAGRRCSASIAALLVGGGVLMATIAFSGPALLRVPGREGRARPQCAQQAG